MKAGDIRIRDFLLRLPGMVPVSYTHLIPFAAGLLWENDLDYPAAKALSSQLFSVPAFEPVPEALLEQAMRCMDSCRKVICCRESFGTLEDAQKRLLAYAKTRGLSERDAQNCV